MKNAILYLLIASFMMQSCHAYKAVDLKETQLIVGENYKITQEDKTQVAKLVAVNDSLISVSVNNVEKNISISNIKKIEEQEFSLFTLIGSALLIGTVWITVEFLDYL